MRRAADGITLEDELEEGSLAGGRREEGEDTPRGVRLAVGGVNDAECVPAAPLLRTENTMTDRTSRQTGHSDGQDTMTDRTPRRTGHRDGQDTVTDRTPAAELNLRAMANHVMKVTDQESAKILKRKQSATIVLG